MKAQLLPKLTKKEKAQAKIMAKFLESLYTPEAVENANRMKKIMELENKTNPLGLTKIWWDNVPKT